MLVQLEVQRFGAKKSSRGVKTQMGKCQTEKKRQREKEREIERWVCLGKIKKKREKMSCGDPQLEREREREGSVSALGSRGPKFEETSKGSVQQRKQPRVGYLGGLDRLTTSAFWLGDDWMKLKKIKDSTNKYCL